MSYYNSPGLHVQHMGASHGITMAKDLAGVWSLLVRSGAAWAPSLAGLGLSQPSVPALTCCSCPVYRGLHRGGATAPTNSNGPRRLRLPTHRPPSSLRHLHLRHPCSPRSPRQPPRSPPPRNIRCTPPPSLNACAQSEPHVGTRSYSGAVDSRRQRLPSFPGIFIRI
eukprot:bmy_06765T0